MLSHSSTKLLALLLVFYISERASAQQPEFVTQINYTPTKVTSQRTTVLTALKVTFEKFFEYLKNLINKEPMQSIPTESTTFGTSTGYMIVTGPSSVTEESEERFVNVLGQRVSWTSRKHNGVPVVTEKYQGVPGSMTSGALSDNDAATVSNSEDSHNSHDTDDDDDDYDNDDDDDDDYDDTSSEASASKRNVFLTKMKKMADSPSPVKPTTFI